MSSDLNPTLPMLASFIPIGNVLLQEVLKNENSNHTRRIFAAP